MHLKTLNFLACFFGLLHAVACVNIAKLKETSHYQNFSGVGPACSDTKSYITKCPLMNGVEGECAEICKTPQTKDAYICCHERYPTTLFVYYCCEVGESYVRTQAVGGVRTAHNEFPYMAALGWYAKENMSQYKYRCGGAFISSKFVLTAAHCTYIEGLEPIVVLPGGNNKSKYDSDNPPYVIEAVHVHPDYDDDFAYNDIALIQIVGVHEGATIDIWRRHYNAATNFTAIGYGDTTFGGTSSDVLLKVFLEYVPSEECQRYYSQEEDVPDGIANSQLCAQDPKNIMDTCQGDSGGPLIMTTYNKNHDEKKEYIVGITSFGFGCALSAPGIYTRVATFTKWIFETIKPLQVAPNNNNSDGEKYYWT